MLSFLWVVSDDKKKHLGKATPNSYEIFIMRSLNKIKIFMVNSYSYSLKATDTARLLASRDFEIS